MSSEGTVYFVNTSLLSSVEVKIKYLFPFFNVNTKDLHYEYFHNDQYLLF